MGERNDLIERLRDKLPGIQTPMMNGDNLAITLCSHFDNPNQPEDEFGWSKDAVRGQYEVLDAIHAHYATTIATLSEALAEAEKKGAEDWQPIETAPQKESLCGILFATKSHVGGVVQVWWSEPRRAFEDMEGDTYLDAFAWRPLPAPPRDLSQGGQHG